MFMFATGIENSNPTVQDGKLRRDELEECGFYKHWKTDFDICEDMGIRFLRIGPPLHKTWLGVGKYDWEFTDLIFNEIKKRDIVPIVDLCHFGLPDWLGNFQNPDFANLFDEYARALRSGSPGCSCTPRSTRCSSAPPSPPATAGGTSRCSPTPDSSRR